MFKRFVQRMQCWLAVRSRLLQLCVCDDESKKCEYPYVFDPKTCRCQCVPNPGCLEGEVFDEKTCSCICDLKKKCYSPKILNPETCRCQCPEYKECSKYYTYDYDTCQCVCDTARKCDYPLCAQFQNLSIVSALQIQAANSDKRLTPNNASVHVTKTHIVRELKS